MLLIPAIDLKGGRCVRLRQGRMEEETVYSDDPLAIAARWIEAGARRLHIIDLDGAAAGEPVNVDIIHRIADAHPEVPIQVGGGIRDDETIETYINAGVQFVILGTKAVSAPHFVADTCVAFPGHILVALDAKDGKVAIDGWSKLSNHDIHDLARKFERDGVESILFTDIGRDGMLSGVNVDATAELARSISIPVLASGGVRDLDDIRALCARADEGISGVIVGRSIYDGTLDLTEGQKLADALTGDSGAAG